MDSGQELIMEDLMLVDICNDGGDEKTSADVTPRGTCVKQLFIYNKLLQQIHSFKG